MHSKKGMLVLSGYELKRLLAREALVSVNLFSGEEEAEYEGMHARVMGEAIDLAGVKRLHEDRVYVAENGELKEASFFAGKVYALKAVEGHAPTIEINGIRMHRVPTQKGVGPAPEEDAENKIGFLGLKLGEKVLDTCCGLGYSAIAALHRSCTVTVLELDENVLRLAELNPWSRPLFDALKEGQAELVHGNCLEEIRKRGNAEFDAVVHDPPRFNVASDLYAQEFYGEVWRVLDEDGKLFHYTGKPMERHGGGIRKGVQSRLRKAGFRNIEWNEECLGFRARK